MAESGAFGGRSLAPFSLTEEVDVLVAGAGPAGAVCAAVLAAGGCRVALCDRPDDGRFRIGETLPAAAARGLRNLGFPLGAAHRKVRGTLSCWGGKRTVQDALVSPEGPDLRLDRAQFDAELRAEAFKRGVISCPEWVRYLQRDSAQARWQVELEGGAVLYPRWVVDATGRRSTLARRIGVSRQQDASWVALYGVGELGAPGIDRTLIESTADGFWYAAHLPNGAWLVALHTQAPTAREWGRAPVLWRERLAATRLLSEEVDLTSLQNAQLQTVDARGGRLQEFSGDGWIACGDAALSFDPVASQGLLNACATAEMAAHVVLDGGWEERAHYNQRLGKIREIYLGRLEAIHTQVNAPWAYGSRAKGRPFVSFV